MRGATRTRRSQPALGAKKNLAALVQEEIRQEVDRLLTRLLGQEQDASSAVDLEASEMAIRSSMHQVGGVLLERLLAEDPGYQGPSLSCGHGHQASFVDYRHKTVVTVLSGLVEVSSRLSGTGKVERVGASETSRVRGTQDPVQSRLSLDHLKASSQGLIRPRLQPDH